MQKSKRYQLVYDDQLGYDEDWLIVDMKKMKVVDRVHNEGSSVVYHCQDALKALEVWRSR